MLYVGQLFSLTIFWIVDGNHHSEIELSAKLTAYISKSSSRYIPLVWIFKMPKMDTTVDAER